MRLGVFGGTFDPPHIGHLVVAQQVYWQLKLDRLLWIPASVPPHKLDRSITPGPMRLRMVRAAIDGDDRFEASDAEIRREGPSYTVDTLRGLGAERPDAELVLVLGADQLAELSGWREPEEIGRLARVVGFSRAGEWPEPDPGEVVGVEVERVEVPRIDVSSTEVRRRAGSTEPIRYLVSEAVRQIVEAEGLYER